MRGIAVALLLAWPSAATAAEPPWSAESADCTAAITTAERFGDIPAGLLTAIGHIESGRVDPANGAVRPWPWTINVAGSGHFFGTKTEAVAATEELQGRGVVSIDVGCMQVNLMHHPAAFATLEEAFDPAANALYAARFLRLLFSGTGDWPAAVAAYHSQTGGVGAVYREKVLAAWTPPGPALPPATPPRPREFTMPDRIGAAGLAGPRWSASEHKVPFPGGTSPAAASRWIERVIGDVAGCSSATEAGPAAGDSPAQGSAVWKAAAVCPTSPFAKPAALRRILTQP
jgi:Transglycosylase SLT domain